MDSRQAREILALYRPGTTDAADPLVAEALDLARRDPELAAWFEQHCAACAALRDKLRAIPVPPGLKRRIILDRPRPAHFASFPVAARFLAAAAAVVVLVGIGWVIFRGNGERGFANYRARMVTKIQRGYYMDYVATNQTQIQDYFRARNVPVDYTISTNLQQLPSEGAAVLAFGNRPVELLCLYDGQDAAGNKNGLWVFITGKTNMADAPAPGKRDFQKFQDLATVSWTAGDRVYLLAGRGDEEALKKYLE